MYKETLKNIMYLRVGVKIMLILSIGLVNESICMGKLAHKVYIFECVNWRGTIVFKFFK